ncbi:cyanophycin synthetase [Altibacter sp.]|uniref:UDP-N-acetylmuramate--L-alanine ligase n=1 Tax=Altibacter sp. TaxID=2024823 RepID=UPI000C8A171D|nr:cyanophycin synthetase [Altibacter sp.]MAP54711.1 UDP-N-acetylmuramate--L-alanine ligase [Altibacter sp.]
MKEMKDIEALYFVGIGGIGMSALARYCKLLGKTVSGYDKTPTDLTAALMDEGIDVTYVDAVSEIPEAFQNKEKTLIVYTPAIPGSSRLLHYFTSEGYTVVKRSSLLGAVTENSLCLAVAGTHGKTTTSAILGHLLAACDMPVTAFLGGIAENYGSNFISNGTAITVVEADEFDRSFLTLRPDIACVTSMDADHLDIYGNSETIEEAFKSFAALLPDTTNLLFRKGLPLKGQTVAVGETADFEAQNIRIEDGSYRFDLKTPNTILRDLVFNLPGHHNLHNAVTALGMAILSGIPTPGLPKALQNFKGVQRRFSYKIKREDLVLIDDYAHHPTEIDALHQAVEEMYPQDRKLIVFQPHLFSRTKDFASGFAQSLSKFDEILLLDIYPAREEPMEGITSEWLLGQITASNKQLITKEELVHKIQASHCRIKMLVGAGDIGAEVGKITKILSHES